MENCLVTKLKGSVNGIDKYFGGLVFTRYAVDEPTNQTRFLGLTTSLTDMEWRILEGEGHFTDASGTADYGKVQTNPSSITNNTCKIVITPKYKITSISNAAAVKCSLNLKDLAYMTELTNLRCYAAEGKISDIDRFSGLTAGITEGSEDGVLDVIPDIVSLTFTDKGFSISKNTKSAQELLKNSYQHLNYLFIQDCGISGTINDFANIGTISSLKLVGCAKMSNGSIEDFVAAMVNKGRTSGTMTVRFSGFTVTYQNNPIITSNDHTLTWNGVDNITFE